jgi:hypothetical protein
MKTNLSDSISRGLGEQHAEKLDQSSTKNVSVLGVLILKKNKSKKMLYLYFIVLVLCLITLSPLSTNGKGLLFIYSNQAWMKYINDRLMKVRPTQY